MITNDIFLSYRYRLSFEFLSTLSSSLQFCIILQIIFKTLFFIYILSLPIIDFWLSSYYSSRALWLERIRPIWPSLILFAMELCQDPKIWIEYFDHDHVWNFFSSISANS